MKIEQFVRFLLVGAMNTGFSYGLYACLIWAGFQFVPANFTATVAGIVFSFRMQGRFVFSNTGVSFFQRYLPAWLAIWFLNVTLIAVFVHFGHDQYSAGAMALAPVIAVSYLVQRKIVFKVAPLSSARYK
ncbi:GtrA family protein [Cyanobium sp. L1E-Cus]|uniref:GtrA family protein n=1 Tax=Cyanobium sp. L1E-Cus TaxID=2823714 RepID=UPI0020CFADEB|nr:GtrA family protein [Cyanobium sp. L1E-Cus]MCP9822533.1 GtrA family protein [Cyanobium sp. L1E-Cus]